MGIRKLIVAHRGGKSRWHENTLEAVQEAITCGADMVEFDVRRTADGELIVHHDEAIGEGALAEMEYSEALRRSTALGYRIPQVSELLDVASGRILLNIELKESGCEEALISIVFKRQFCASDFAITSFDAAVLKRVREVSPDVIIGLLVYDMTGEEALKRFYETGANFLGPDYQVLNDNTLEQAKQSRVPLLPWTANDPTVIRSLLCAPAVIGVITDQTSAALRIRDEISDHVSGSKQLGWETLTQTHRRAFS
jgi:glycerophosphoryl diester phosphodiesterase